MKDTKICALCYHRVANGLLCATCESDRQKSIALTPAHLLQGRKNVVADATTEQGYIDEFWARAARDGLDKKELLTNITRSICNELGCNPRHEVVA